MNLSTRRPGGGTQTSTWPAPHLPESSATDRIEGSDVGIRAYLITGGRSSANLSYETMVSAKGSLWPGDVRVERAALLAVCKGHPTSVAELAAHLHLPIGVVRVLASDLIEEGLLAKFDAPADKAEDVSLLSRLISGVRAL
jgi:Protein of unknown function (DUF742)